MKKFLFSILTLAFLAGSALFAQDLTGNWQATLKGTKDQRLILVVTKADDKLQARLYSIDETPQPFVISSISQTGSTVKFAIEINGTAYEGKMNAAGDAITGTWTQAVNSLPLDFVRAPKENAWAIPAPPAPRKPMPA